MKRVLIAVALVAPLFNPISALAIQTDVNHREVSIHRRWLIEWTKEAKREARLEAKREAALADVETASESTVGGEAVPGAVVAGCLTASQVASYARGAGFPEGVISTMVAISYRESHWCPGAVNASSGATGLWQIYPGGPQYLDPAANAAAAYAKYAASGLTPWGM